MLSSGFFAFDEGQYLAQNPDVTAAVTNNLLFSGEQHFTAFGAGEGRAPFAFYNEAFYLATNPDVAAAVASGDFNSGYEHFILFGAGEGRIPSQGFSFDESLYLALNPDVAAAVTAGELNSGLEHFARFGYNEGRFTVTANNEAVAVQVELVTQPTDIDAPGALLIAGGDPGQSLSFDLGATDTTPLLGIQSGFVDFDFSAILGEDGHSFAGSVDANTIIATSGNDTIAGGAGADIIVGGDGIDTYVLNPGDSTSASAAAGGITWDVFVGVDTASEVFVVGGGVSADQFSFTDVNVTEAGLQAADLAGAFGTLESLVVAGADLELAANGVAAFRTNGVGGGFDTPLLNASFAFIDENGIAGWTAGVDSVIQILGATDTLGADNFV